MRTTRRVLRLLPAILAVWCLGCDAFESVVESLLESRAPTHVAAAAEASASRDDDRAAAAGSTDTGVAAADGCDCTLGHAAVVSVATTPQQPPLPLADFVDAPPSAVLPAPEPLLRPPVA